MAPSYVSICRSLYETEEFLRPRCPDVSRPDPAESC